MTFDHNMVCIWYSRYSTIKQKYSKIEHIRGQEPAVSRISEVLEPLLGTFGAHLGPWRLKGSHALHAFWRSLARGSGYGCPKSKGPSTQKRRYLCKSMATGPHTEVLAVL